MYYLKNSLLLILILTLLITMVGCNKQEYTINKINVDEIYTQEDNEYYVYFYQKNCPYCEDCFEVINEYINNPSELNLYVCDLTNNQEIKRKNQSGQGPDGGYWVDNVSDYKNLWIAGVPSLIKIKENDNSYYVTSGRKNILAYIEYLNDKENHKHNYVDGKCICGEIKTKEE